MENKKIIKKLIIIFLIVASVCSTIIGRKLGDLDEIWNYNISNNFAKGLLPYKDYNTIVTPLLQMLAGIILKILPNELITMRVLAVLLISGILLIICKILNLLKINKDIIAISLIGIFFLERQYFCIDYNFFALFLVLFIMYLEILHLIKQTQDNSNEYKCNLIIGILVGLVVLTKQTIGIVVSATIITYMIIFTLIEKIKHNENLRKNINNILFRLLGMAIPISAFILYLLCTRSFSDFIDYAILGIKTFSNKIEYKYLLLNKNLVIKALSITVPISFLINFGISLKKKDKQLFIVNCISIAMFVVAFPISDNIHFLIGSTTSFIALIYNTNNLIRYLMKRLKNRNIKKIIIFTGELYISIIIIASIYIVFINYKNIFNNENYSKLEYYKYIPIESDYEEEIKMIDEYIQKSNKKVYILNFDAAIYMIPINRYNKDFDMFLKGNLGGKGEEGQIEKIKAEDAKYLIIKDGMTRNWQNPELVRTYIKEHLKHTDDISNFEVYENY